MNAEKGACWTGRAAAFQEAAVPSELQGIDLLALRVLVSLRVKGYLNGEAQ